MCVDFLRDGILGVVDLHLRGISCSPSIRVPGSLTWVEHRLVAEGAGQQMSMGRALGLSRNTKLLL